MKIELKDVLGYTGIELGEDATPDTFKKSFDEVFIRKDQAIELDDIKTPIVGETTRKFATELKRAAKESGLELSEDETKLPVSDLARAILAKKDEVYTSKIQELETSSKKPSEAFEALQTKYAQLETKFNDIDTMKNDLASKLTEKDKEFEQFQHNFKLGEATKDIWGKVNSNLSETASELERRGFVSAMNDNYKIQLDGDVPVITTKEGSRIPNPNKHGEFLSPTDVLLQEAEKLKIRKVTDTSKVKPHQQPQPTPPNNPEGVRQSRLIRHK
jgi:chromosome segregation ATPase